MSRLLPLISLAALSIAAPLAAQPVRPFTIMALEAAQASGQPILVDVFAPWCPTCRAQAPTIDSLATDPSYARLVILRLDYDNQTREKAALGVTGQSALIAYRGGRELGRTLGVTDPLPDQGVRRDDAAIGVTFVMGRRALVGAIGASLAGAGVAADLSAPAYDDPEDIYRALRNGPATRLRFAGGVIDVVFAESAPGLARNRVFQWVRRCGLAVQTYFGRYPVARHGLLIVADDSDKVGHAVTFGFQGSATRIHVGRGADAAAFARDWVLVHEMTHVALPNLPRRALWLQEGNATYIEPIAQAQAGQLPVDSVWRQSLIGMPTGEPRPGDGGMDGTTAHARLYWGGATFWLRSEIAIHEQSGGRYSLRDALRAANRASGGNAVVWLPEQLMDEGDTATGTHALRALYERFALLPTQTDLPGLFLKLGVGLQPNGGVVFDDAAPLAALRRAITRP